MIAGENSPRNITSCKSKIATNVSGFSYFSLLASGVFSTMDQNLGRAHNASGPGKDDDISWTEKFHADKDAYHGVRLSWYTLLGGNINHTKGITLSQKKFLEQYQKKFPPGKLSQKTRNPSLTLLKLTG